MEQKRMGIGDRRSWSWKMGLSGSGSNNVRQYAEVSCKYSCQKGRK